ncbi:hypothetical protein [Neobacillus drentensis]|uniref:hypothetical protein n=1 Tax=Neobacillus drentensis TaxID=220684 RepID=UPI002FFF38F9
MKKLDYLTRGQIQKLHNLKSDRNAQRVLKQMEDYLSVMRNGENVYYLNAKGRAIVNCDKVRKSTGNVQHYIMRNYIYLAFGCPTTWRNEIRIINEGTTKKDRVICVPDALFKNGDVYTVVEVDNTQTMKKNHAKIEKYRILKQRLAFGMIAPKFVWITTTEHRRQELMKLSEGLQTQVFTLADFNA